MRSNALLSGGAETTVSCGATFQGKITRNISFVWNGLVSASNALYPEEVYDDIKHAYDDELIEPFFIRLEDIDETLQRGKERVLDELHHHQRYSLITDTISEMEGWACFHPQDRKASNVVSVAQSPVQHAHHKGKHKRKLAKAARRRNRR
jgi:hypothetical protein